MVDLFENYSGGLDAPAGAGFAITPNDSADLDQVTRALYVGEAGNVSVTMARGGVVTFFNVPAGTVLPIRVSRVRVATTASALVGLA